MNRREQRAAERRAKRAAARPLRGSGITVRSIRNGGDTVDQHRPQSQGGQQGQGGQQQPQGQQEGFRVDPGRAFTKLQQRHADEMGQLHARTAGDLAAKDAAIDQLAEENQMLRSQVEALNAEIQRRDQSAPPQPDVIDVPSVATNGHHSPADGPVPSIPSGESVPAPAMRQGPSPS